MKKTILLVAVASMIFGTAEAKNPKQTVVQPQAPVQVFSNNIDTMSYALGMNVGTELEKNLKTLPGGKYNKELFIKGFISSLKGDSTLLKSEFANTYFRTYMTAAQAKEVEVKKAAGESFLAQNKTKPGVSTTASGLQYQVLKEGAGLKPKATDTVVVHYTGTLIDGTKFDSSVDRGEPVTFPLNHVIKGWTEGVQLMSVGSKYKFFIPSDLGYGPQGSNGVIPPYATLVFEVELLDVKPFKEAPVVVAAPATPVVKAKPILKTVKKHTTPMKK